MAQPPADSKSDEALTQSSDDAGLQSLLSKSFAGLTPSHLLDSLTSHLGTHNPFSHPVDSSSSYVWLQDNTAWSPKSGDPTSQSSWQAEYVAAYFIKDSGHDVSSAVAKVSQALGLAKGDKAEATIAARLAPILNQILPAHTVKITLGGDSAATHQLGPSDASGISQTTLPIPGDHEDGSTIVSNAVDLEPASFIPARTTFAANTGWAIISDIDDTIKRTLTNSPTGILRTTFVDDPQPIAGMPAFYARLNQQLSTPPIWYLSASPYNLYPFLRAFREAHYPPGALLLREASWMNLAGFLASMTVNTKDYKVGRMESDIQPWWPSRKMVCIGDSTQSDPEAYAAVYAKYPGWVRAIWIRKVRHVTEIADEVEPGDQEKARNSDQRFAKAFEGVPAEVWKVFDEPADLEDRLQALVKEGV